MIELKSKIVVLPKVFFISNRDDIKKLPIGIPFIFGDESTINNVIRLLEYEVLYESAVKSGYPFNFKKILEDKGYKDLIRFGYSNPLYLDYVTEEVIDESEDVELTPMLKTEDNAYSMYIRDASTYVSIDKLKKLDIFPVWLKDIEKAIETNIQNSALFNPYMYNKKLDGVYGAIELYSPKKNLIIIDISGSIPKGVSSTCLTLAKNMAESYYADLIITGSKSTLYEYKDIYNLNIKTLYKENGTDNDQVYFKKLVSSEVKEYGTAIVFGDGHSPSYRWRNRFNKGTRTISTEDGKKICKWKIDKLISFHTSTTEEVAGYAEWFTPKEVKKIKNWVKYLD